MRIATTLLLALVSGSLMVFAAPDVGEVTTNTLMIAGSAGRKLAGGYGVCQCQTAWWYNGNQYSGSTYDYSPNGQPWCMVNEYCDSNTCDGTHGQQNWKYCPKCECKPSWSYKGCTYTGCSTVDSPNRPWCVVNDDCLTFDGLTYGQKWKYCPSTSVPAASPPPPSPCPVASPPPPSPCPVASPPPPSPCPVASPPPPSPCPVASPPPPAVSVTPCASPPPPAVSTTPCPSPAPKCYCLPSYVYKGCTYTGCTTAGSYPNKPWCVVNADCPHWDGIEAQTSPSGQKWMYCPYTPPVTQPKPPAKPVKCGCLPSYVYKGCTYSGCTTVDSYNKPWCVINADCPHWDGIEAHTSPSGQKWMYCPSTPPVTKPKPPPVTCRCEPVFWYKGCKYTGPTTVDSKRAWCVVNDDCPNGSYNGKEGQTTPPNKKWMYV